MTEQRDQPSSRPTGAHYLAPGWFTCNVANRLVTLVTRASGQPRRTPVNLLTYEGRQYLVSARGHGQWVRNVRAAGGELQLLRGRSRTLYHADELDPADSVAVLRAYLKRWKAEVGVFFDGIGPDSTDEEIRRIAPRHPVFALTAG